MSNQGRPVIPLFGIGSKKPRQKQPRLRKALSMSSTFDPKNREGLDIPTEGDPVICGWSAEAPGAAEWRVDTTDSVFLEWFGAVPKTHWRKISCSLIFYLTNDFDGPQTWTFELLGSINPEDLTEPTNPVGEADGGNLLVFLRRVIAGTMARRPCSKCGRPTDPRVSGVVDFMAAAIGGYKLPRAEMTDGEVVASMRLCARKAAQQVQTYYDRHAAAAEEEEEEVPRRLFLTWDLANAEAERWQDLLRNKVKKCGAKSDKLRIWAKESKKTMKAVKPLLPLLVQDNFLTVHNIFSNHSQSLRTASLGGTTASGAP